MASRDIMALDPSLRFSVCSKAADLQTAQFCATIGPLVDLALEPPCPVYGGSMCLTITSS
jgi:hypothetical protein